MTPFWDSQTTFWALAGITDMSKLGYSYPDFNGLDILNLDTTKAVINARIYELYGGSSTSSAFLAVPKHLLSNEVTDDIQPSVSLDQGIWEWMACVEFKKYELGTSFFVFIFLGEVSKNPLEWCVSPNYVRGHHALAFINSFSDSCANCISQQDLVEEGFVHLKYAIARHLGLGSLEPNTLELYLTDNLQWRVQKVFSSFLFMFSNACSLLFQADGEVAELQTLEVSVFGTPLSLPQGTFFPVPEQACHFNRIMHSKAGGS